jgi:hypothetical protein
MTCEQCRTEEAVVHLSRVQSGAVVQRHLCRTCAVAEGVDVPPPRIPGEWTVVGTVDHDRAS